MATPTVETQIWLALRTRMEALVFSPAIPVIWPGESASIPNGNCFEVNHQPNSTRRPFLGSSDQHQYLGLLTIGVMTIPGPSQRATFAIELASDVAAHFPADLAMRYGDVTVKVMKQPNVSAGFKDEQRQRWIVPVTVEYECFA